MAVNKSVQLNKADDIEDIDFATMLEESFKKTEEDSEGTIVEIRGDEALVDIGKKSEGRLQLSEITDANGNLLYNVGDTIKVVITGRGSVSHKKALRKEKVKAYIQNYDPETQDNTIEVKIIGKNKGGFVAQDADGVEFFMPRTQSGFKNSNDIVGKTYKVKIIKVDKDEQSIVISRKKILDEDRKKRKEALLSIVDNEEVMEGTVKKITTYGMFVDVGGVDGLVHYSEISYKGPVNPSSMYNEGDKVLVKVMSYDNEKRHLSLSIKAAMPDPWEEIKDGLDVGDTIKVIVSNIEPYGAFVDLGNDIEGFLHISEISWDKNIKNPKDHISEGQDIDVEVIEIDAKERRLRVSLKNLLPKPFDEFRKSHKEGDVVEGIVTSVTAFGAFVKIGSVEGLLHNEDASWDRNVRCKELFKNGDLVKVKIVRIDSNDQKISLSMKELKQSPVQDFATKHKIGDIVKGKIRDIKDFGIFVELDDNVDALIRKEDIGNLDIESLKVGDDIEAAIAFIDEKRNRIRLSIKFLAKQKEREVLNEINDNDKITLGDIIKEQLQ
ncbi:30S ribosomal protein S1 [Campylobacter pinnipediorum]|uniref:30S ribosomal protein S1 n=1 Tax=Campylobacter pinnipediorum TaxID=1965231 RepID=UPI000995D9A9|nr:30S ribosomal protein S1 [Campylobacter pinnipediorum]AQW81073.1 30S ribosomal protein S1 [Campylobacter pinnipediorum subsp. pinnipediorum]AQW82691.1 30S ribosomal protein S1 [Campylobacter pinnipediorum subsp. pinnipediorum]OPA77186.1 30S ribosomal protein S1 [Campylobacter pinnipediorum subsp. pinnipediorum]